MQKSRARLVKVRTHNGTHFLRVVGLRLCTKQGADDNLWLLGSIDPFC
jgi:hypothetical protein